MKPFVVLVSDLLYRPAARRPVEVRGAIDSLALATTTVAQGAQVLVGGVLEWVEDGVLFTGRAAAPWTGECRRCLAPVEGQVDAELRELFWVKPVDDDSFRVAHESVDLAPMAREAILLDLPMAPLCKADCAGLCVTCGADLNAGPCDCPEPDRDPRWAALDSLRSE